MSSGIGPNLAKQLPVCYSALMIERGEALSEYDLDRISDLHSSSIQDSIPTLIGGAYAKLFYRWLAASELEWIFVERVDGDVEAACVVSLEPKSLYGRVVRSTLPALARSALSALLSEPAFRGFLWHIVLDLLLGGAQAAPGPEITYVFTNEQHRGRGLGRCLIDRADAFLYEQGVKTYYVKTIDDTSNLALAFYEAAGFCRIGSKAERGRQFVVFNRHPAIKQSSN